MTKPKIGIIITTTRQGRFGDKPAQWIFDIATQRQDLTFELVDLRDFPMPMFDAPMSPGYGPIDNDQVRKWSARIDGLDGLVFVTAEYNHSISGVLKNALDSLYPEFKRKPAAFVGYGSAGGARAVQQLRAILTELSMVPTRAAVHIGMEPYLGVWKEGKSFNHYEHLVTSAGAMLDELAWYAKALKAARDAAAGHAIAA